MHDEIRRSNPIATVFFIGITLAMLAMLCRVGAEALDTTAANQERYYGKPATVTYEYPAAYRLQTPTPEQMDHLEHLRRVAQVGR